MVTRFWGEPLLSWLGTGWLVGWLVSWLGTGQPGGPNLLLVAATLTQPVWLEPQQTSTTYIGSTSLQPTMMNQAPVRPQRG